MNEERLIEIIEFFTANRNQAEAIADSIIAELSVTDEEIEEEFKKQYFAEDNKLNLPHEIWNAACKWMRDRLTNKEK